MSSRAAAVLTAAVLALSACSSGADDEPSAGPSPEATADVTAESSPEVTADEGGDPIAGTTLPISYVPGGELALEILGFEEADELIRMRLRITARLPSGTDDVSVGAAQIGEEFQGRRAVEAELIDTANLKAYSALLNDVVRVADGEIVTVVLYYAAPEDDVDTFDVNLGPKVAPLTDVPYDPS